MFTIKINERKKKSLIKFFYLILAIFLMAFSQSILSYTHRIGMDPIDALTQSIAFFFGSSFSTVNYFIVAILVITAIIFSKKGNRLITSTAFIPGFTLSFFVMLLSNNVTFLLPGLIQTPSGGDIDIEQLGNIAWVWGVVWFIFGYTLLVFSIGMWVNVGFALRPYEAMLINVNKKIKSIDYSNLRVLIDFSLIIGSIVFVSLSLITNNDLGIPSNWFGRNSVGPGTVFIMLFTGKITKKTISIFSKPLF